MYGIAGLFSPLEACIGARAERRSPQPHSSRARQPKRLALDRPARGTRPHPAQYHRPGDRRHEDERVRIVVNGEFYDFERQRRELEQRGHHFRTRSDSEIALHLDEDFGVHCLGHLRGEFAFVLWDETNQLLLAARDRFGIKPLYYAVRDDTLYLASEVKALFAAGVPARWDHEYFYQHATGPAMPDRTLSGVSQFLTSKSHKPLILRRLRC
jgi:asparagine synthetase B (glutamine-hydrolysing)